jgi:tRNA(Ile)-lysidine synthase
LFEDAAASYDADGMASGALMERIARFAERHAMFRAGHRVGVAVSGGADSVFLLHALRELAPRWGLTLSVVHVEHGIRGGQSKADAEFVRALAAEFAVRFHLLEANVLEASDNLEQAARRARQTFFQGLIATGQLDRVATGHTRSDQAETVLYRIVRGSGLAGLTGIRTVTVEGLVRPLLDLERAEIVEWLNARGVGWREDPTNQDRAFARNRIRHEILPLLRQSFNPRLDSALANLSILAQAEETFWEAELENRNLAAFGSPPILNAAELSALPTALARRVIRRAVEQVKGDLRQIDFAHIERVLEMSRSSEGHDRAILPGVDVLRSFEWIRMTEPATGPSLDRDFNFPLPLPGFVELPKAGTRITLQVLEKPPSPGPCDTVGDELDWLRFCPLEASRSSLEVRNWRPGDQYCCLGKSQPQKVKFLFQDARVPLWERRVWPIITYNGSIVWARRFGAAAEFAAGPEARMVVKVTEGSGGTPNPLSRE